MSTALFTAGVSTLELGEYLGIEPRYTDGTTVGGSSFVIHVAHAVAGDRRPGAARSR